MSEEFRAWYEQVLHKISKDVLKFYEQFYPKFNTERAGKDYRLNPCPFCGHRECFTITPNVGGAQCFSGDCEVTGNHIKLLAEYLVLNAGMGTRQVYERLAEYYHVALPEEQSRSKASDIKNIAANFYHEQLLTNLAYLNYQLTVRKHTLESIKKFKLGASFNYQTLKRNLLTKYTEEEIKDARVFIPEGLFVYPYIDPFSKDVVRFNTKNPFKAKNKDGSEIKGYSTGSRYLYTTPLLNYDYAVFFEGENDIISYHEEGGYSGFALGGKISDELIKQIQQCLEKFKRIYTFFDNDEAGENYTKIINDALPHKPVHRIIYDAEAKDPDDYFKKNNKKKSLGELFSKAEELETDRYKIANEKKLWYICNRIEKLEFFLERPGKGRSLVGTMSYYKHGSIKDKAYDADLAKIKYKPLNFFLMEAMEEYFDQHLEDKSFDELVLIYPFSRFQAQVIKLLANAIANNQGAKEELVLRIREALSENVSDLVLKEEMNIHNSHIFKASDIVQITPGQFFHVRNGDAFMYFTYVKQDGENQRQLPYLISNSNEGKELIRLDLYKRADAQCMLLLKNRYALPMEIPNSVGALHEIALAQEWAEKYVNNDYRPEDIFIPSLVRTIENYARKFLYFHNDIFYKFISIWAFGTYCYGLFEEFPYLYIRGEKGTGKTVLDTLLSLVCFNPKIAVGFTTAALFRTAALEGGTFILDEMENISSRNQTVDSTMADVLKGGYQSQGFIRRCNPEKNNEVDCFNVYGPKVISNINGLEDIIQDRSIEVFLNRYDPRYTNGLEDPKFYAKERRGEMKDLSSRCCLAVLDNFKHIFNTSKQIKSTRITGRLSKIMLPLLTVAALVGEDYVDALEEYYSSYIVANKDEVALDTPEGVLRDIVRTISQELVGSIPLASRLYTSTHLHKYKNSIVVDPDLQWFELDTMHIKTFIEESLTDTKVNIKDINVWVKHVANLDLKRDRVRKTVSIEDEFLIEELRGNTRVKVYAYKFYIRNILSKAEIRVNIEPAKTVPPTKAAKQSSRTGMNDWSTVPQ